MKWIVTGAFLASLMATPVLAARQHLNRDEYWNVTPVAQIFPSHHRWDHADPRHFVRSTMQHWPSRYITTIDGGAPRNTSRIPFRD
jgi:hypothetical protein